MSAELDLDLGMALLSGPLYFRLLITQEPLSEDYIDKVLDALFAGVRGTRHTEARALR